MSYWTAALLALLLLAFALTVTLSIILHGVSAAPWARIYKENHDDTERETKFAL